MVTTFRYLFEQLDLKKDGRIDAEELATGLQSMGYSNLSKVGDREATFRIYDTPMFQAYLTY